MNRSWAFAYAVLLVVVVMPPQVAGDVHDLPSSAEDSLSTARDLYSAAEYESALQLLNRLRAGERQADQARTIDQYRAFCLLALGRSADAEQAIAAVVSAEPSFRPSDTEVSPRVRSAFSEVRRRMWPSLVQQRYATAKGEYDRKNFPVAATGFAQVLELLADPEAGDVANRQQLSDIRVLATEFRELSIARTVPPAPAPLPASSSVQIVAPLATVPQPAPQVPPAASSAQAPSSAVSGATGADAVQKSIFGPADANVVPPIAIRQTLPPLPSQIGAVRAGVLEIVVDETGAVESATMKLSVNPYYDRIALEAARSWKYRPATLKGEAVKYRKSVQILGKQ